MGVSEAANEVLITGQYGLGDDIVNASVCPVMALPDEGFYHRSVKANLRIWGWIAQLVFWETHLWQDGT